MNEQLNPNNLKEGEDFYYTPEGYKCFTEKYHLKIRRYELFTEKPLHQAAFREFRN